MSEYIEKIIVDDGEQQRELYTLDVDAIVCAANEMVDGKRAIADALTNVGVSTDATAETLLDMAEKVVEVASKDSLNGYAALDYDDMYKALAYAQEIYQSYRKPTSLNSVFSKDTSLVIFPTIDTSEVTDCYTAFVSCTNLSYLPSLDWSKVTDAAGMFNGCKNLSYLPVISMPEMTAANYMFLGCSSLKAIEIYCPNVQNATYMFNGCSSLSELRGLDGCAPTSSCGMFHTCKLLTQIPDLDFSKNTNASETFAYCTSLTSLPDMNLSLSTNMWYFCYGCSALTEVGVLNTSAMLQHGYLFGGCKSLTTVKEIDFGAVAANYANAFANCSSLVYMVVKNIGKSYTAYDFSSATVWGTNGDENRQTLLDSLLAHSYDRATAGMTAATITLSANSFAELTEEEIASITAKGFTILSA